MKKWGLLREKYEKQKGMTKSFFPYIELYEFESMILSDVAKLEEEYFEYDLKALKECVKVQSNPELINDGEETKRRLRNGY